MQNIIIVSNLPNTYITISFLEGRTENVCIVIEIPPHEQRNKITKIFKPLFTTVVEIYFIPVVISKIDANKMLYLKPKLIRNSIIIEKTITYTERFNKGIIEDDIILLFLI